MANTQKKNRILNHALWVVQVTLAILFIWAAGTKLLQPAAALAQIWPWTATHRTLVRFTGCLDLLAGLGLVLPLWLRIRPVLTVYAAIGAFVLMIAAIVFHIIRGETAQTGINIVVAFLTVFVAWGRGRKHEV